MRKYTYYTLCNAVVFVVLRAWKKNEAASSESTALSITTAVLKYELDSMIAGCGFMTRKRNNLIFSQSSKK